MPEGKVVSTRLSPEAHEEVLKIAKAHHRDSLSDAIRQLIDEALAHRAEAMTASQFELVSNRIDYMEKRFSAFHAMTIRAIAKAVYFAKENMLLEADDEQRSFLEDDAEKFAENFIGNEMQRKKRKIKGVKEAQA